MNIARGIRNSGSCLGAAHEREVRRATKGLYRRGGCRKFSGSCYENLSQNEPLTNAEFDSLRDFLKCCEGGRAMNIEQLDAFFAALITGGRDAEQKLPGGLWRRDVGCHREAIPGRVAAQTAESSLTKCLPSPCSPATWTSP